MEKVKIERKKYGYTQQKISDMLGIELYTYKRIENGKTTLTFDVAYNIAEVLNIKFQPFLTNREMSKCEQKEALEKMIEILQTIKNERF